MFINQSRLHDYFDKAYLKFSPQLRNLVTTTDGPILACLHSSTSIPRLFSVRIANLLATSKTLPGYIVCFMSTDSDVHSMKLELTHFFNEGAARPNIHTIHSFCEIIMESYIVKGDSKQPKLISTLETVRLLKELIAAFPSGHPLKRYRADVFHEINNLKKLFAFIKQDGYTTEYLNQQIDTFSNQLLAVETPPTVVKNLSVDEAIERIDKLRAGIGEFSHWQKLLTKYNRYDKDDLIKMAVKILEEDEKLLSIYQLQFQYIQAEEQAFTSQAAKKLLILLTGGNEYPNIFLTKYKFDSVNDTHHTVAEAGLAFDWIEIKTESIISHLQTAPLAHLPLIHSHQTVESVSVGIVNQVFGLLQEKVNAYRIAIVIPTDNYDTELEQIFTVKNIPYYSKRTVAILMEPLIKKIIQLLRYITTEIEMPFSGDELLFEILHSDFFQVPPIEIASLSVEVNSKKYGSNPTSMRKLLQERANAPARDLFDTGMDKDLKKASAILEKLIQDAGSFTLDALLENINRGTEIQTYINKSNDSSWLMQLLNAWTSFIQNEITQNPALQLNQLISALDTMQTEGFPLNLSRTIGNANGVQIIQPEEVWAEEMDYLFIIGANNSIPDKREWVDWIEQFASANDHSFHEITADSRLHFLIHLLHVVPNVSISFSKCNRKGIACSPDRFIAKIISEHLIPVVEAAELKLERTVVQPAIISLDTAFITPIVKKFVMNVSALNSYLNCPLGFYYKNILRIPNGKTEALEFGSAIHYALEQLFKKMAAGYDSTTSQARRKEVFPSATEMIEDFKLYLYRHQAGFTQDAFERRMAYGEEVLQNYYAQYINSWKSVVSVERNIRGVTVNGVPLKGKLDKLEFDGNDVTIIDYKSGNVEKALLKTNPPNANDPNGGDYWRQAVFYKLLVDHYNKKAWKVAATEFDFVEPDKDRQYRKLRIQINASDIETVTQQLTTTWNKIQDHDFYTGCGRPDCHWCNFVKDNHLAVATHQL